MDNLFRDRCGEYDNLRLEEDHLDMPLLLRGALSEVARMVSMWSDFGEGVDGRGVHWVVGIGMLGVCGLMKVMVL